MHRRKFLQISTFATLGAIPFWQCESNHTQNQKNNFKITIHSDQTVGHWLWQSEKFEPQKTKINTEYLVVGGGIAGLVATTKLKEKDVLLLELSDRLGGTASAFHYEKTIFGQGAHYDLAYPNYFGEEILKFWEELEVITFDKTTNYWSFKDTQYMIPPDKEGYCFDRGIFRDDVMPESPEIEKLGKIFEAFVGKMKLPTRLIEKELKELDTISFEDFLKKHISLNENLKQAFDYQMLDDFGGTSNEVSALAGIYYYAARPYHDENKTIFSPPEGNFYFINKMAQNINNQKILTNHLVKKINETSQGFLVDVIDVKSKSIKQIEAKKIIYAAPKHTLKYIYPQDYPLFSSQLQSPWVVLNFVLKDSFMTIRNYWQNEMITDDLRKDVRFLGFVDSETQAGEEAHKRVLTAYYAFSPAYRQILGNPEKFDYEAFTHQTIEKIAQYFYLSKKEFSTHIEQVFGNIMGHAMPVPTKNYLFRDLNAQRKNKNLVYAGVDVARLPLMMEATDSALEAVKLLLSV